MERDLEEAADKGLASEISLGAPSCVVFIRRGHRSPDEGGLFENAGTS